MQKAPLSRLNNDAKSCTQPTVPSPNESKEATAGNFCGAPASDDVVDVLYLHASPLMLRSELGNLISADLINTSSESQQLFDCLSEIGQKLNILVKRLDFTRLRLEQNAQKARIIHISAHGFDGMSGIQQGILAERNIKSFLQVWNSLGRGAKK